MESTTGIGAPQEVKGSVNREIFIGENPDVRGGMLLSELAPKLTEDFGSDNKCTGTHFELSNFHGVTSHEFSEMVPSDVVVV